MKSGQHIMISHYIESRHYIDIIQDIERTLCMDHRLGILAHEWSLTNISSLANIWSLANK